MKNSNATSCLHSVNGSLRNFKDNMQSKQQSVINMFKPLDPTGILYGLASGNIGSPGFNCTVYRIFFLPHVSLLFHTCKTVSPHLEFAQTQL